MFLSKKRIETHHQFELLKREKLAQTPLLTPLSQAYHNSPFPHTKDGFKHVGCDGKLHYEQKPLASYSLYSDFNWYEVGDVISIGNADAQYYCFPKTDKDVVAKARLATEELYKIKKAECK